LVRERQRRPEMMGTAKGMLCLSVVVLAAGSTAWGQATADRPSGKI